MLRLCAILLTSVAVSFTAEAARSDAKLFRVTLLGTGSPDPVVNRFSASTLVEAGEQKLLFDAGRGVTIRLWQCQVPLSRIDVVFFTHYHSDHTIGLPDLLLTGWLPPSFGHRVAPLHVVGPVGAKSLLSTLAAAYVADIKGREEEQHLPAEGVASKVDEFSKDGVVYEKDGVRVTAFEVDHGFKPAYGYRIDYDGRSVLLSGDTKLNDNVVKHGEGVDLLIHEVFVASAELLKSPAIQHILSNCIRGAAETRHVSRGSHGNPSFWKRAINCFLLPVSIAAAILFAACCASAFCSAAKRTASSLIATSAIACNNRRSAPPLGPSG